MVVTGFEPSIRLIAAFLAVNLKDDHEYKEPNQNKNSNNNNNDKENKNQTLNRQTDRQKDRKADRQIALSVLLHMTWFLQLHSHNSSLLDCSELFGKGFPMELVFETLDLVAGNEHMADFHGNFSVSILQKA